MKSKFAAVALTIASLIAFSACSNSTEPETNGSINISAKYSQTSLQKAGNLNSADITIAKATYILREIKFKSQSDSTDGMFKTTPLVLDLNIDGNIQDIGELQVPYGTYNRLEFDIHRSEPNDTSSMSAEQKVKIRPFFEGDKYSIIIEGTYFDGTVQNNFIYKSKVNMKQKINLTQPLIVSESENIINATMIISSFGWFSDGANTLDPNDTKNSSKIDNNIRNSIKVYKDKNKDGIED